MEVEILSYDPDDECVDKLGFTWEVIDYEPDLMTLQINFDEPKCISIQKIADHLAITFYDQRLIADF